MSFQNEYNLEWVQLLTYRYNLDTGRYGIVVYGQGPWVGHIMDWRGLNMFHGRIPNSPIFRSVKDAATWIETEVAANRLEDGMELSGHHAGENECLTCGPDREEIAIVYLPCKKKTNNLGNPVPKEAKTIRYHFNPGWSMDSKSGDI